MKKIEVTTRWLESFAEEIWRECAAAHRDTTVADIFQREQPTRSREFRDSNAARKVRDIANKAA